MSASQIVAPSASRAGAASLSSTVTAAEAPPSATRQPNPAATVAVTVPSGSSASSSTVGTRSAATRAPAANTTLAGTSLPSTAPCAVTDTGTVRASSRVARARQRERRLAPFLRIFRVGCDRDLRGRLEIPDQARPVDHGRLAVLEREMRAPHLEPELLPAVFHGVVAHRHLDLLHRVARLEPEAAVGPRQRRRAHGAAQPYREGARRRGPSHVGPADFVRHRRRDQVRTAPRRRQHARGNVRHDLPERSGRDKPYR